MSEPATPDALNAQAQRALCWRACGAETKLERAVRQSKTKGFTPDVAVLQVGVAAMDLAEMDRSTPIAKSDLMTLHLSEIDFRNQRPLQERTTYGLNTSTFTAGKGSRFSRFGAVPIPLVERSHRPPAAYSQEGNPIRSATGARPHMPPGYGCTLVGTRL